MSLPSPSSTVMLLRDCTEQGIQALLVQRNKSLRTGGGAWVFPGGRVDVQDYEDDNDHFLAAQNAAVREVYEETGLELSRQQLTPFAHWTTPPGSKRRFATWFFVAQVRDPAQVQVDGGEIVDHRWFSPENALQCHRNGHIEIMPPTFVSLCLLGNFGNCVAALSGFREREVQHFNPRIIDTARGRIILYDDDAGYAARDPHAPGRRHRIYAEGTEWRYENTVEAGLSGSARCNLLPESTDGGRQ